jgi:hypothetical protein
VHPQGDVAEWLGTGLQNPVREFESPRRLADPQFSPFACFQLRSIRVLGALLRRAYTICNQKLSEWREVLAAASPAGWPPPQHGAAARRRRAAAPQNTTDPHSETLCIKLVLYHF